MKVKKDNKIAFAKFVKDAYGIEIDPNSIYDAQIKRLHAYKRQLLNLFHIMYLYQELKADPKHFKMRRIPISSAPKPPRPTNTPSGSSN
jgi:glucan phosphorylase